jgi:AcrR family transcriptional regulator
MAGDRAGALAHINDEVVLSRLQAGEDAARIAEELGVHKSAIYHRYSNDPRYKPARKLGTHVRIDESEREIKDAQDPFTLARARERFRAVAWRAEREFPDEWGQRTHVTVENIGDLGEKLRRSRERVVPQDVVDTEIVHTREDDQKQLGVEKD